MSRWTLPAPTPSELGDHDVLPEGTHLAGRRIALLVTGGIAAMKIPLVARALRRQGAEVVAFASREALRYVTAEALEWSTTHAVVQKLTAAAEHLSDAAPFDAYLIAPATYNTLNKIASGVADGVITSSAASALGRLERGQTAVLVAPTMHGSLHNRILVDSLRRLHELGVRVIPPRDAYGKHNLPDEGALVAEVARALSRSPLRGRRILVAAGSVPVPIDGVGCIGSRFRDRLGIAIASELHLRGADALLIHGDGLVPVPATLPQRGARTYDEYRTIVNEELARGYQAGVFSAAVAAYRLAQEGEIPSPPRAHETTLRLLPTAKIIAEVRAAHPDLYMVPFKYQDGGSREALLERARARLAHFPCVIAIHGEEQPAESQRAWLLTRGAEPVSFDSPRAIASALADQLEAALGA
jgi:phosphopantothenoylcysteine decarboxylase/phosphopantothenate--cysteine ligase